MSKKNIKPSTANLSMNVEVTEVKSEPREIGNTNPVFNVEAEIEAALSAKIDVDVANSEPVKTLNDQINKDVLEILVTRNGIRVGDIVRVTKEYYGDVVIDTPHATTARFDNDLLVIETPEGRNPVLQTLWGTVLDIVPPQHLVYVRRHEGK